MKSGMRSCFTVVYRVARTESIRIPNTEIDPVLLKLKWNAYNLYTIKHKYLKCGTNLCFSVIYCWVIRIGMSGSSCTNWLIETVGISLIMFLKIYRISQIIKFGHKMTNFQYTSFSYHRIHLFDPNFKCPKFEDNLSVLPRVTVRSCETDREKVIARST